MTARIEDSGDILSPRAMEQLLRLLAAGERRRLSSLELDGRTVWIKRFDAERKPIVKKLHSLVSPLLPLPVLRASPTADAGRLAGREARKAALFREAGFAVPALLHRGEALLVLSEVAEIAETALQRLSGGDAEEHDAMLADMAAALGRAHARGLCHGRPHPRDLFRTADGRWGFLDFEEEPEASMPLAAAQARDVWLMFMEIAGRSRRPETPGRAFAAWRTEAPAAVVPELRRTVSFFSLFLPVLRLLRPFGLGKDGRRMLETTSFLRSALRGGESFVPAGDATKPKPDEIGTPT